MKHRTPPSVLHFLIPNLTGHPLQAEGLGVSSAERQCGCEKDSMKEFGGAIPPDDVAALEGFGVGAVFTPGTRKGNILQQDLSASSS